MSRYREVRQEVLSLAPLYLKTFYEEVSKNIDSPSRTKSLSPWAVFDIDDTLLSMGNDKFKFQKMNSGTLGPIPEMISLLQELHSIGFKIAFITARSVSLDSKTVSNLSKFIPASILNDSIIFYKILGMNKTDGKIASRRYIDENLGTIVFNIGDQESDLEGGYSILTYKLPSFY